MDKLSFAIKVAVEQHWGQKDKSGNEFILHPIAVMMSLDTLAERICGVLHDVVEDTSWTLNDIEKYFGKESRDVIDAVSIREGEKYFDFIERSSRHPIGRKVKIADVENNLRRSIGKPQFASLEKRYRKALTILVGEDK